MTSWWYAENGQQFGPIDESSLVQTFRAGKIGLQTLVWREGMAQWQNLATVPELRSLMAPPPRPMPPQMPPMPQAAAMPAMRPQSQAAPQARPAARPSESAYAASYAQPYQGPQAVGGTAQPELQGRLANYSERYLARSLDSWIACMVLAIPCGILYVVGLSAVLVAHSTIVGIIMFALSFFVDTLIFGIFGNTTGKALLGVRVLRGEGRKLSFGDYLARNFMVWLRGFGAGIWGFNIVMPLLQANRFNKSKPASYDISSNTQVMAVPVAAWRKAVFTLLYILFVIYLFIFFIIPTINSWNA